MEGDMAESKRDNIPTTVEAILELLDQALATVSRMRPEPPAEEPKGIDAPGLHATCVRARDKAQRLCRRLDDIADAVGPL